MVVVDQSYGAKHAMMWALTHVANRGDFLTLLLVLPHGSSARREDASALSNSLGSLCKACKPEVVPLLPSLLQVTFFSFIYTALLSFWSNTPLVLCRMQ